jgi:hypothetical protein
MSDPDFNLLVALDVLLSEECRRCGTSSEPQHFGHEPDIKQVTRCHRRPDPGARRA